MDKMKLTAKQLLKMAAVALTADAASVVFSGNPTSVMYQLHFTDGTFGTWVGPVGANGERVDA